MNIHAFQRYSHPALVWSVNSKVQSPEEHAAHPKLEIGDYVISREPAMEVSKTYISVQDERRYSVF